MPAPTSSRRGEVFRPPRHIREKVSTTGGVPLKEAVGKATAVLKQLEGGFATESDESVARLQAAFAAARAGGGDAERRALYDDSHAIRGSAATFGYPLATRVADALCKFIDGRPRLTDAELAVIEVHIQAIRTVFAHRLTGDGGTPGRALLPMLEALRNKA